jgi:hypothetical protein
MIPSESRLPAALEAAIGHVKATVTTVAERVASGLGTQAQSTPRTAERDILLAAQIDLRRQMNTFHLSFSKHLVDKVHEEIVPRDERRRTLAATDWLSLSLVDDDEVEQRMLSDRIAQQIRHACEWELREMAAYMGAVLGLGRADEERNPLRAEVLGLTVFRSIVTVSAEPDPRKILAREFGQLMAQSMPTCYQSIVDEMKHRNVQPVRLAVKTVHGPGQISNSGYSTLQDVVSTRSQSGFLTGSPDTDYGASSRGATSDASIRSTLGSSTRSGPMSTRRSGIPAQGSAVVQNAQSDAQLMALLRRLTVMASRPGTLDAPNTTPMAPGRPVGLHGGIGAIGALGSEAAAPEGMAGLMAVNLIRAHREELMQASPGKLDHMVIDVVGSLFDQILSDPKVPPQMARQIARLQLPVLRVALTDATFFSSRRHPVRRFVNRIASLACAFDDFDEDPGRQFLERVKNLVQEIVEGDFDQLDLYSAKLSELEEFIARQTQERAQSSGAAAVLASKESELRVQQRYMLQLSAALHGISMPKYLLDFVAQVWSQALVLAARQHGVDSEVLRRFRGVGRDLVMSVQPKGCPVLRKRFLMQLPTLMKDLNEGLKFIGWPEAAQKDFFGKLLPSHAESLKAAPLTELEHNLLAKQLEGIFHQAIPGAQEFSQAESVKFDSREIEQCFTPEEAQQVGLVAESAVDWSGKVDIDLSDEVAATIPAPLPAGGADTVPQGLGDTIPADLGLDINLDLMAADPAEPSHGPKLMDHIHVGFAYQMLLKDQWQKVCLSYVSPGRSFFVFTHGRKHHQTISFTSRMLSRMCESHRFRAVEHAYLMERATARARRQLAALKSTARH